MPKPLKEVEAFMQREQLASFATVNADGAPHVVPVFFTYDDGRVYVQTDRASVKVRNLMHSDNVAVTVYSEEEAVMITGKGKILTDKNEFIRHTKDHVDKYRLHLDAQGRDSLGIPLFDEKTRCVVEVTPRKIRFW